MSILALSLAALLLPAAIQTNPPTDRPSGTSTGATPGGPAVETGDAKANHNTVRSSKNKGGRGPAPASGGTPAPVGPQDSTSKPD